MDTANTLSKSLSLENPLFSNLKHIPNYLSRPLRIFRDYDLGNLRFDLISGVTVGFILLPQAIAFALIAELPPEMGLYTAVVAAIVGAIWGSTSQMHTGPSNAISLLVLSTLLTIASPGTPEFIIAAGMLAVMVGLFQLVLGLARLGLLVNFVSHSVIVGFSSGAGVLIGIGQLRHLLGLSFSSQSLVDTIQQVALNIANTHPATAALGIGTMVLVVAFKKINPRLPGPLFAMIIASAAVFIFGLDRQGVDVIGQLPSTLPPLAELPLFDLEIISRLSTGALAVGAIGLVQTMAIARSISAQTGERLDSNQEFVGQGLANLAAGIFSGYPGSGSFSVSAVKMESGGKSAMSGVFCGLFVLIAMLTLAPLAAYLPRTALAGVLIVVAYGMVRNPEILRIWRGTRADAMIMLVTFLGTLFLPLEFAVLVGILLSLIVYIMKTSVPKVFTVLPDAKFKHFIPQHADHDPCVQLGIFKISGDLYFGAVSHVEEMINDHLTKHPEQRFVLLRMHGVNQIDFSGIHMLESLRQTCLDRGGDIFFMKVQPPLLNFMRSTSFYQKVGPDNFLEEDAAIGYIFHKILDPAICIYECPFRAFKECQNLPKQTAPLDSPIRTAASVEKAETITAKALHKRLHNGKAPPPTIIDVREPREFKQGHIPQAELIPLPELLADTSVVPEDEEVVFVCRGGRRSGRAASLLKTKGHKNVKAVEGGMLAWQTAGLLEAIER